MKDLRHQRGTVGVALALAMLLGFGPALPRAAMAVDEPASQAEETAENVTVDQTNEDEQAQPEVPEQGADDEQAPAQDAQAPEPTDPEPEPAAPTDDAAAPTEGDQPIDEAQPQTEAPELGDAEQPQDEAANDASASDEQELDEAASKRNIKDCHIEDIPDQYYTGREIKPSWCLYIMWVGDEYGWDWERLEEDKDYVLKYKNNVKVGTATITITGKGKYTGSVDVKFKIKEPVITWKRLYGQTKYDTMAAIVKEGWSTADTVIVARGDSYKDALAACGLAGTANAPIVLTDPSELVSQAWDQLDRLKPKRVYVVGGPVALSNDVVDAIAEVTGLEVKKANSSATTGIIRVYGQNACSTSAKIALAGKGSFGTRAIIATDKSFKDALSVAPVAYAKHWPILLAQGGTSLNKDELNALTTLKVKQVYIVGGTAAVSNNVVTQLSKQGIKVLKRLAGANGVGTSRAIARFACDYWDGLGMKIDNMGIATSQNFPDALAGAALCGKKGSVLLLADGKSAATSVNAYFAQLHKDELYNGYIFGGELAVQKSVYNMLPKTRRVTTHSGGPSTAQRNIIVSSARSQKVRGIKYVYATSEPGVSFDCSGFVSWCYEEAGIDVPGSSSSIAATFKRISASQAKAGDVVYWPGHVAIYLGPGWIIESTNQSYYNRYGTAIREGSLSSNNSLGTATYYRIETW